MEHDEISRREAEQKKSMSRDNILVRDCILAVHTVELSMDTLNLVMSVESRLEK